MLSNLKQIFTNKYFAITFIALVIILFLVWQNFTDLTMMIWNYGKLYANTDIILSMMIIFWFSLFVTAFLYKSFTFWSKESIDTKSTTWILSGTIWTILSWASCCSVSLVAYLWLLPIINFLPYKWLELKIISIFWLGYAIYDLLKNLNSCKMKTPSK